MTKRVYQVWKGKNIFFCKGRLIFGPDAKSLVVTILLIVVPVVFFCVYVASDLVHRFPDDKGWRAVTIGTIVFSIYVLVLLLRTSSRDPGIVPRSSHPPDEELYYDSSTSVDIGGRQTPTPRMPRTKEVMVNGLPVKVKYCETCMLYRPPRCSHCSVCNNCVERFDHHCPWVGQCIGARNYKFFFMFVSSAALLCVFVLVMSALNLKFVVSDHRTLWKAMKVSPASIALVAYCFVFLWFVGGLTCFHLYLISRNQANWWLLSSALSIPLVFSLFVLQTTYENFRYGAVNRLNAYDRGCLRNFTDVFCAATKPSMINFRSFVQEDPSVSTTRQTRDADAIRRVKVEDNCEIDNDFLKITQRANILND